MANNNVISLLNLDPDTAKQDFISYLQSQSTFKSYDFTGTNLNQLISIFGVDTFKRSFYYNMINSESWLDSCQIRGSAVSHAKELNYLPQSYKSAQAVVTVTVPTDGTTNVIALNKGTTFSGRAGTQTLNFSTQDTEIYTQSNNGVFTLSNLSIYEGVYLNDTYIVDVNNPTQPFVITNKNVDISSVTVMVLENGGAQTYEYQLSQSLLGLNSTSLSYFLECNFNEQYQVRFGNDVYGRQPQNKAMVVITYRVSSGEVGNGASLFNLNTDPTGGHLSGSITVSTVQNSLGGASEESIEMIQFNAPRAYQTQERGVNVNDYIFLLKTNFPEIQAITAIGGESLTPPQFGSVLISVVLSNVNGIPQSKVDQYTAFLKTRSLMSPIISSPQFIYYRVNSVIEYNKNQTTLLPNDIETIVSSAIINYNAANFDDFSVDLIYSQFTKMIDNSHPSIKGNDTDVYIYQKLAPAPNTALNIDIKMNIPLYDQYSATTTAHPINQVHAVWSSKFVYGGQVVNLEDDAQGNIRIVRQSGGMDLIIKNIGTVNYSTGEIQLSNIVFDSLPDTFLKVYAKTAQKNITVTGNYILTLEPSEMNLLAVPTTGN